MIGFKGGKFVDQTANVAKAVRKAGEYALKRLGFLVRAKAMESLKSESGPSAPGEPPHTHERAKTRKGKPGKMGLLPSSILYGIAHNPDRVIIGPSVNVVGIVGAAFEHGGTVTFRGASYPPRPFMGPALGEEIGQLPGLLLDELAKL